jgi:cell division protein FtsB
MKWLVAALIAALLLLQYRLWLSNDGVPEVLRLSAAVAARQADNARAAERNRRLAAEVRDLKQGYTALEERARSDLGMIAGNESFYEVVPHRGAGSAAATAAMPVPAVAAPMVAAPAVAAPSPKRTAAAR